MLAYLKGGPLDGQTVEIEHPRFHLSLSNYVPSFPEKEQPKCSNKITTYTLEYADTCSSIAYYTYKE